ncbi:MAG: zf-HC2 domain-containing protein [Actinomycetota bacterium]|nr:zf-HC2 domain-containing protein [Actinomycetota bacterium]
MSRECDEALTDLYTYLDAELDTASNAKIKAHLDECPGCEASFDFEGRLRTVVKARLNEDVPDSFVSKLKEALADEADCPPE